MKSIFIILVVFFAVKAPAQNLLPNPSFEDTLNAYFQVSEWITMVSPDYFTSYDKRNRGTPQNFAGYQSANTGQAYMGLRIYSLHSSNDTKLFRECIQNELADVLVQDSTYCLQLFVSLADSMIYASKNKLGVYFSNNQIRTNNFFPLPYVPQVIVSPNTFIQEKQKWVQFDLQYTAKGGEKFITIGNFKDSTEIDTLNVGGGSRQNLDHIGTYYYIDDVYLGSCDSLPFDTGVGIIESELIGRNHRLYPNPASHQVNLAFEVKPNEQFKFTLYDLQGRLVQEQLLKVGSLHGIVLQKDYLVPRRRLYLYQIRNANGKFLSGKLVVE